MCWTFSWGVALPLAGCLQFLLGNSWLFSVNENNRIRPYIFPQSYLKLNFSGVNSPLPNEGGKDFRAWSIIRSAVDQKLSEQMVLFPHSGWQKTAQGVVVYVVRGKLLYQGWYFAVWRRGYFPPYLHDFPVNVCFIFPSIGVSHWAADSKYVKVSSYQKPGGVRLGNGDREKTFAFQWDDVMVHPDSVWVLGCSGTCCSCCRGTCLLKAWCCCWSITPPSCSGAPHTGWSSALAHGCCSGAGTDATLQRQGRATLQGGGEEEKRLTQGLALRADLTDMDLGFSHEKVLRSLRLGSGIGIPSH